MCLVLKEKMADFLHAIFEKIVVVVIAITVAISSPFTPSNSVDNKQILPTHQEVQTASPTPSLTSSPSAIPKPKESSRSEAKIVNNQFEITINNMKYLDTLEGVKLRDCAENDLECKLENSRASTISLGGRYRFNTDLKIKNISISPFIIGYQLSNCEVVRNGNKTGFNLYSSGEFNKGVLPGELVQVKIDTGFDGVEYDSSGNKIQPSSDLRVKSCRITLKTKDGSSEAKTIQF